MFAYLNFCLILLPEPAKTWPEKRIVFLAIFVYKTKERHEKKPLFALLKTEENRISFVIQLIGSPTVSVRGWLEPRGW